jgi:hypothetical protein
MRYRGAEQPPVKPLPTLFAFLVLALAVVPAAAADSRTPSDARNDFKGSHWPGPEYVWGETGACKDLWMHKETQTCEDTAYVENLGALLDISSVGHGHKGRLVTQRLSTYRAWQNSLLSRANGGQISFFISTDRDGAFERRLDVALARGKVAGVMRNRAGRVVGRGEATRPNAKTVRVAFARKLLGPRVRSYRWLAFAGIHCRRQYNLCGDRSPNGRLVAHRLS